ncbi:hypothetical protein [Accumulibacter sp.]|uniref:hypothetical protein n=1 Tax=Accumulibacter sp. TaxID=2053492 RepID=UPI0028C37FE7|nr:hypothetical protein [Accumulibacter sp.]
MDAEPFRADLPRIAAKLGSYIAEARETAALSNWSYASRAIDAFARHRFGGAGVLFSGDALAQRWHCAGFLLAVFIRIACIWLHGGYTNAKKQKASLFGWPFA